MNRYEVEFAAKGTRSRFFEWRGNAIAPDIAEETARRDLACAWQSMLAGNGDRNRPLPEGVSKPSVRLKGEGERGEVSTYWVIGTAMSAAVGVPDLAFGTAGDEKEVDVAVKTMTQYLAARGESAMERTRITLHSNFRAANTKHDVLRFMLRLRQLPGVDRTQDCDHAIARAALSLLARGVAERGRKAEGDHYGVARGSDSATLRAASLESTKGALEAVAARLRERGLKIASADLRRAIA